MLFQFLACSIFLLHHASDPALQASDYHQIAEVVLGENLASSRPDSTPQAGPLMYYGAVIGVCESSLGRQRQRCKNVAWLVLAAWVPIQRWTDHTDEFSVQCQIVPVAAIEAYWSGEHIS